MKPNEPNTESFDEARELMHRQMLSAVSHDLKTPLATIIGSLEIYTRMDAKLSLEKKQILIKSALQEAYRLDHFVTNILDMSKLEGGMAKITISPANLGSLVQDSILRLGPKVDKNQLQILAETHRSNLQTDAGMLSRAIGILLDNAIKHGNKDAAIFIMYGVEESEAYVCVRDHGTGIPNGKMEEIFSKYTRFSKNDQQNAGTGLGLAICRLIMELLSGSVSVKNHTDGGAEFMLRFPS